MSSNDEIAIKVSSLHKAFKLPHEKRSSIKSNFVNIFRRQRFETQKVLSGINFEIKKGEFFGIVGRNGSGKSTLLKLLAGIYTPDKGDIQINGMLTPFIELGVGFNPELTGRENVFLNGALLGFNRKQMAAMYDEIVAFAELERFMDQKLKNYSSGMQVRLAFSIAIRANTDILVLDEVLAVGDAAFQQKCNDYFEHVKKLNKTVVLVTHDMNAVNRYCDRALLLENGRIKDVGSPKKIANQYSLDNLASATSSDGTKRELGELVKKLDVRCISPKELSQDENFEFEISYELSRSVPVDLGMALVHQNQSIIEHNTQGLDLGHQKNKRYKVRYKLPLKYLTPKHFSLDVAIFERKGFKLAGFNSGSCSFIVTAKEGPKGGILVKRGEWEVKK